MPRRIFLNLFLLCVSGIISLAGMELILRVYCRYRYGLPFFASTTSQQKDALLGWRGKTIFGDTKSSKFKVLFVGDSFTASIGKRLKDKMYFHVVKNTIDIELFVVGGGGYGTLQEFLAIDKYIDDIRPDLVVLQTSSNDFINNSWNLEKKSYIHNNSMVRPYLEDGRINYRFPRGPLLLRQFIIPFSRLGYFTAQGIDRILAWQAQKGNVRTIEDEIRKKGMDLREFKESSEITERLLGMIRDRCGPAPLIAFPTFDDEPYFRQFRIIFHNLDVVFLSDIPQFAWTAEGRGAVRNDSHWGEKGHARCGMYLANYIKNNFKRISDVRIPSENPGPGRKTLRRSGSR